MSGKFQINIGTPAELIDSYEIDRISISYALRDIKKYSERDSSFTKPITILHTKNTDKVFRGLFNINSDNSFDATKKVYAEILEDSYIVISGYLQVTKVTSSVYEVIVATENVTLFTDISGKFMRGNVDSSDDLAFTPGTHEHTITRDLVRTLANTTTPPDGTGYKYPFIDYKGTMKSRDELEGFDFRALPAVAVLEIFDKIFSDNGYTYDMTAEMLAKIKTMYLPYNGDYRDLCQPFNAVKMYFGEQDTGVVLATRNEIKSSYTPFQAMNLHKVAWDGFDEIRDFPLGYESDGGIYHIHTDGQYVIEFNLAMSIASGGAQNATVKIVIKHPDESVEEVSVGSVEILDGTIRNYNKDQTEGSNRRIEPAILNLTADDAIFFVVESSSEVNTDLNIWDWSVLDTARSWFTIELTDYLYSGLNTIDINDIIPFDYKQGDFIKDIFTLFNVQVEPDTLDSKLLHLKTPTDYYSDTTVHDWTDIVDSDSVEFEDLKNTLQSEMKFSFAEGEDSYNNDFQDKFNEPIHSRKILNDSDFSTDEEEISMSHPSTIFKTITETSSSSTPTVPTVPVITDFGGFKSLWRPRILFYNLGEMVSPISFGADFGDLPTASGYAPNFIDYFPTLSNKYLQDNDDTDNMILAFDSSKTYTEEIDETNQTIYNRYYLEDIGYMMKGGFKYVKAEFALTSKHIHDFKFSSKVSFYVDNVGEFLCRVNIIKDFSADGGLTKVELIALRYYAETFDTKIDTTKILLSQESINGGGSGSGGGISVGSGMSEAEADLKYAFKNGDISEDFSIDELTAIIANIGTAYISDEISHLGAELLVDNAWILLNSGNTEVDSGLQVDIGGGGVSKLYRQASTDKWLIDTDEILTTALLDITDIAYLDQLANFTDGLQVNGANVYHQVNANLLTVDWYADTLFAINVDTDTLDADTINADTVNFDSFGMGALYEGDLNFLASIPYSTTKTRIFSKNATNKPTAQNINDGFITTYNWTEDMYAIQTVIDVDGTGFAFRNRDTFGIWSDWLAIYNENNANKTDIDWLMYDGFFSHSAGSVSRASGFLGSGWEILDTGAAFMDSLELRRFLRTPELIKNQVQTEKNEFWFTDSDTISEVVDNTTYHTLTVNLKDGDTISFEVDDILRGIFNSGSGFETSFVKVIAKTSTTIDTVTISGIDPLPFMRFARQGNETDAGRQGSTYVDGLNGYIRILFDITDETIAVANIATQLGNLDGLTIAEFPTIGGQGLYSENAYLTGEFILNSGVVIEDELISQSLDIIANADGLTILAGRVTTTEEVNTSQSTVISQNSDDILLRATSVTVNLLTDEVDDNTADILINSTAIGLRVIKNDVINQINISTEGILISADNIEINGSVTFSAGYDPTEKLATLLAGDLAYLDTVGNTQINNLAITDSKIQNTTITGAKIVTGTITATQIDAVSIAAATVTAGNVNALILTIDSGTLGGFNVDDSYLWTGTKQTLNAYSIDGLTISDLGAIRAQKFRVEVDGTMYAVDGTFSGDITGSSIVGGTIRTATSAQRIEISGVTNSLSFYDPLGDIVISIDDNIDGGRAGMRFTHGIIYMEADTDVMTLSEEGIFTNGIITCQEFAANGLAVISNLTVSNNLTVDGVTQITGTFLSTTDGDQFVNLSAFFSVRCIGGVVGGSTSTTSFNPITAQGGVSGSLRGLWMNRDNSYSGNITFHFVAWGD